MMPSSVSTAMSLRGYPLRSCQGDGVDSSDDDQDHRGRDRGGMELFGVDEAAEPSGHRRFEDRQRNPLQCNADKAVDEGVEQALTQLIGTGSDGGDDDERERHVHRGGDYDGIGTAVDEHLP